MIATAKAFRRFSQSSPPSRRLDVVIRGKPVCLYQAVQQSSPRAAGNFRNASRQSNRVKSKRLRPCLSTQYGAFRTAGSRPGPARSPGCAMWNTQLRTPCPKGAQVCCGVPFREGPIVFFFLFFFLRFTLWLRRPPVFGAAATGPPPPGFGIRIPAQMAQTTFYTGNFFDGPRGGHAPTWK